MGKTSISVPEMRRLLGMKKVEAYWLVKQGRFKVILVGGKMRIMLDSFEEWYGRQFRYKKVNGPEPGQLLPASLTIPEAADILGLNPGSVYELIKNHAPFETFKVDGQTRILKENFETWYQGQSHYKKREDAAPQELLDATLSVSDVAKLLGIHRNSVYNMVKKRHLFITVKADDKIRIYKEMLVERRNTIDELKELLGDEYRDYDLVFATTQGTPTEANYINRAFGKLIADNNLPKVVFHSLRHTSTTYKLKLSGGDIKAVQGDTGHAQATMVTERYAHILDDDRRVNAARFQEEFYGGGSTAETAAVTESPVEQQPPAPDPLQNLDTAAKQQLLLKLLTESPDMAALLTALAGRIA